MNTELRVVRPVTVILAAMGVVLVLAGCTAQAEPMTTRTNRKACGQKDCHAGQVTSQGAGKHWTLNCTACHEGVGADHAENPKVAVARVDWTIAGCRPCHEPETATYLYDDNKRVGPFGGSQWNPTTPKTDTFPEYNTVVAGHSFTKDYNEEGAHAVMLQAHYDIARPKFETCLQCKSTKLAYSWLHGKPLTVAKTTNVTLTHTAAPGTPAKVLTIPEGTVITYSTDSEAVVDAKAVFPDGTTFTSRPSASEDATANFANMWAATYAAIQEVAPYGAGCNHCHDPHSSELRVIRQAELRAIEAQGVNPYREGSPKDVSKASAQDERVIVCAQCHVEYTCGKSGVDGKDRDAFGWAKAKDLHATYRKTYGYAQDWKNSIMGEPLIKSQHPETELFWNSPHYESGVSCVECHMPDVQAADGSTFRSHWFTSPYKYGTTETVAAFENATGITRGSVRTPCTGCHSDRTERAVAQQQSFYAQQAVVEKLLAESVNAFGEVKLAKDGGAQIDTAAYTAALDAHRQAHVLWENLAVSENSMGFHNFGEASHSMTEAEKLVRIAIAKENEILGKLRK